MSWTPPSPAGGARPPGPPPYAGPPPAYAGPPPGFPGPPPAYGAPPPRKRRTGLVVLLVALPLALVLAAGVALGGLLTGDKELRDAQGRVTLTVPRTWTNEAGPDAGQRVEQGEDSYTEPDIVTGGLVGDVAVFIAPRSADPLDRAHKITLDEECELSGCIGRGGSSRTEVNGRTALQQVLRHPEGMTTAVLSVESERLVVTVLGYCPEEDQTEMIDLMRTLVVG